MREIVGARRARTLRENPRAGGVLVLTLVAVTTVLGLGAAYMQFAASTTRRQMEAVETKRAFYLAESGLAEAYVGLLMGRTGNVGTPEEPAAFGSGIFWVEATELPGGLRELVSTGMSGGSRAVLSIVVEPGRPGLGSLALFAGGSLQVGEGSDIDAYDSRFGTYADYEEAAASGGYGDGLVGIVNTITSSAQQIGSSSDSSLSQWVAGALTAIATALQTGSAYDDLPAPAPVQTGSNGDVWIASGSRSGTQTSVEGDLQPGPAGTLYNSGAAATTGETSPRTAAEDLPKLLVPTGVLDPGIRHTSSIPLLIQNGVIGVEYIEVAAGASVVLQGPLTMVLEDLAVEENGELRFDTTNGDITLFSRNSVNVAEGAYLSHNVETNPDEVLVLSSGAEAISVAADGDFVGVMYAPEASITFDGTDVYGAVVGQNVQLLGGADLHYDQALSALADAASLPNFMAWRIVDLSPVQGATFSQDPYDILGIDRADAKRPSDAHEDQYIEIKYENDAGDLSFAGDESEFDWDDVSIVEHLARGAGQVKAKVAEAVGSRSKDDGDDDDDDAGRGIGHFVDDDDD